MADKLDLGTRLRYYKREDVQAAIVQGAKGREVAVRYGERVKRPEVLKYSKDVIELVKDGATSFHYSVELWDNPLLLNPSLTKKELDDHRVGWDLVIDIDFPIWESTKLIADAIIKAISAHGVKSVACKFSGNKGFHVIIPFEAFPENIKALNKSARNLFPDDVKSIVEYITDYIDNRKNNFSLSERINSGSDFKRYVNENRGSLNEFTEEVCVDCSFRLKGNSALHQFHYMCPDCERTAASENKEMKMCERCKRPMRLDENPHKDFRCPKCNSKKKPIRKFNLEVDRMLVTSRHTFRSEYSLHEKSGLASIPVDNGMVLSFDKSLASPERLPLIASPFIDRKKVVPGEATVLLKQALEVAKPAEVESKRKDYENPEKAVPEEFFPPCMKKILAGLKDGRKRSVFVLINFLSTVGWDYDQIEAKLTEWNKKNFEPLREVNLKGSVRYHKQQKKHMPPPNCINKGYYQDMQVCSPDAFCPRIKNPAMYAISRSKSSRKS